jgi:hypothetical protein
VEPMTTPVPQRHQAHEKAGKFRFESTAPPWLFSRCHEFQNNWPRTPENSLRSKRRRKSSFVHRGFWHTIARSFCPQRFILSGAPADNGNNADQRGQNDDGADTTLTTKMSNKTMHEEQQQQRTAKCRLMLGCDSTELWNAFILACPTPAGCDSPTGCVRKPRRSSHLFVAHPAGKSHPAGLISILRAVSQTCVMFDV